VEGVARESYCKLALTVGVLAAMIAPCWLHHPPTPTTGAAAAPSGQCSCSTSIDVESRWSAKSSWPRTFACPSQWHHRAGRCPLQTRQNEPNEPLSAPTTRASLQRRAPTGAEPPQHARRGDFTPIVASSNSRSHSRGRGPTVGVGSHTRPRRSSRLRPVLRHQLRRPALGARPGRTPARARTRRITLLRLTCEGAALRCVTLCTVHSATALAPSPTAPRPFSA
jgi:hypothetical protein